MRQFLVFGDKTFRITVPDEVRVTFAPFSPPRKNQADWGSRGEAVGTLRIYNGTGRKEDNILAVFSGVRGFRDLSLGYAEEVAREEGATIWKDDEHGYMRESKVKGSRQWVEPETAALNGSETDG